MEPDGNDVPVKLREKVAFQWVHEGNRMIVTRCVRLLHEPLPVEWAKEEWPPQIGKWRPTKRLGEGGNGEVWLATDANGDEVAVKFLKRPDPEAYARFRAEIEVLRQLSGVEGVLPLLDSLLPAVPSLQKPAWFVMPRATPLAKSPASGSLDSLVAALAGIARTLAKLAAREMSHRDIKPDNLFWLDSEPVIGDFGIADYPGKPSLTVANRKLGPMYYIAPEMLNEPHSSDGRPADVYSLAKTLWVLATGQNHPIPGEHRDVIYQTRLSTYVTHRAARQLDKLICCCTHHNAADRLTMDQFAKALTEWPATAGASSHSRRPRSCVDRELAKVAVQLTDATRLILNCRQCGQGWVPMLKRGGKLPRGYWRCPNGCNAD